MTPPQDRFVGKWLHSGSQRGQDFTHHQPQYEHPEEAGSGATPMRHVMVDQGSQQIGVWVPETWSDEQARNALESNW